MPEEEFNWPIVGNTPIIDFLKSSVKRDDLAQAYLFYGPENVGKSTVAEYFVKSIFCQLHRRPCLECKQCRDIANFIHPEIYWVARSVDEKTGKLRKNVSIEQIRTLIQKLSLRSFGNGYKIAVINDANFLSLEAANALLKTLEEPSGKCVIILIADDIRFLPKTILSRCLKLKFLPVGDVAIADYLHAKGVEQKKARRLAAASFGRPGIAIEFYEKPELYESYLTAVKQILQLPEYALAMKFSAVADLQAEYSSDSLLSLFEKVWRDVLISKYTGEGLVAHPHLSTELRQIAQRYDTVTLRKIFLAILQTKQFIRANVNPKLAFENLVLNF